MADPREMLLTIVGIIAAVVIVAAIVMGFRQILEKQTADEKSDVQVVQRQLKGFAFLQLVPFIAFAAALVGILMSGNVQSAVAAILSKAGK